jgi:hypothetical protein
LLAHNPDNAGKAKCRAADWPCYDKIRSRAKVEMIDDRNRNNADEDSAIRSMKFGRKVGNSIQLIWFAFSLWLSLSLFFQNMTYPGVGWAIIAAFALFVLSLSVYPWLKKKMGR